MVRDYTIDEFIERFTIIKVASRIASSCTHSHNRMFYSNS